MLACGTSRPQPTAVETELITRIALDPLGQLYVVTENNEVIQYRADGTEGYRYGNNTLGELGSIDPANPFSILLYYPDFQTIILLDRTLNEKGRIVLSGLGLLNIELVALDNDNYIWVYDAADLQLKKLDQTGTISYTSDRLNLLMSASPNPIALLARHNRLLLNDPTLGVLLFDQFGRLESTLPIIGAESLQQLDDHTLIYIRHGDLFRYDLRALQESPIEVKIPCTEDCELLIGKEKIFWLENGKVEVRDID
ncbi:MAG: hypothetical protein R2824_09070 [Saprospiraceae bacterium]